MMVKVRVNRFGRNGWLVTRAFNSGKIDIVIINDPFIELNYMVYMFQYRSTHGKFNGTVQAENGQLGEAGAEYVVESTGVFTTLEKAGAQLKGGAKRVVISAPCADAPMFVMGMNHEKLSAMPPVAPTAWPPLAKVIHDNSGIVEGLIPQSMLSLPPRRWWVAPLGSCGVTGRGAAQNIIPASIGAVEAVGVIPELNGKLTGMDFHVPTHNVSVVDLTCCLEKAAKYDDLKKVVKQASKGALKGILSYNEDQVCIALKDHFVKLVSWYDNEFDCSNRVVDLWSTWPLRSESPLDHQPQQE
ncbi:hypothetical protein HPG69_001804, partial [Diceros bicornis minor]